MGGQQHSVGFDTHEFGRCKVSHHGYRSPHKVVRLIMFSDTGNDLALFSRVNDHTYELLGFRYGLGFKNLPGDEFDFGEILDTNNVVGLLWFLLHPSPFVLLVLFIINFLHFLNPRKQSRPPEGLCTPRQPAPNFKGGERVKFFFLGDSQLPEHFLSCLRHERVYHYGHLTDSLEEGVHH